MACSTRCKKRCNHITQARTRTKNAMLEVFAELAWEQIKCNKRARARAHASLAAWACVEWISVFTFAGDRTLHAVTAAGQQGRGRREAHGGGARRAQERQLRASHGPPVARGPPGLADEG